MFAVIRTGGKQYRVVADDVLKVDKVAGNPGDITAAGNGINLTNGDNIDDVGSMCAEVGGSGVSRAQEDGV